MAFTRKKEQLDFADGINSIFMGEISMNTDSFSAQQLVGRLRVKTFLASIERGSIYTDLSTSDDRDVGEIDNDYNGPS